MSACEMGTFNLTGAIWLAQTVSSLNELYSNIQPYVVVALCIAGTLMNLVTVIVLTRPTMQSPINCLLCAVALCDILVMSSVLIFVYHFMIAATQRCDFTDFSKSWAYFLFLHSQTTVIFHATSIWLTVLLAQIRVYTIKRATTGPTDMITIKSTFVVALITLLIVMLANIPNFLTFEIVEHSAEGYCDEEDEGLTKYSANATPADFMYQVKASDQDCGLLKAAFWTNGIVFKVVPCLLLTFSIIALLKIIRDVSTRRKSLAQVMNKKRLPSDHTTPMLVAVLSIFLLTELPQGILHVGNAIFSKATFYNRIYQPLGDIMDLLSLLNSAVNFIIYCAMSRKFRCVFLQLFANLLPERIYRRYVHQFPGVFDLEISRQKPSGYTDVTRTEQMALTSSSHRVSATSMLIRTSSREKMYSGNLLSVEGPGGRSMSHSSVHYKEQFDGRSSLEIHEIKLPIPSSKGNERPAGNVFVTFRQYVSRVIQRMEANHIQDSPQRRMNIIQFETSTIY
ncbi:unnamed protein product [Auanema sp. JU1783]|nr:unnamed protein product [Auanema sp. JU1783]